MTLAGEAVIIWTATGLSVIAMSALKNGEECSTLASTYNLVYDAYGPRSYIFYVMFSLCFYEGI